MNFFQEFHQLLNFVVELPVWISKLKAEIRQDFVMDHLDKAENVRGDIRWFVTVRTSLSSFAFQQCLLLLQVLEVKGESLPHLILVMVNKGLSHNQAPLIALFSDSSSDPILLEGIEHFLQFESCVTVINTQLLNSQFPGYFHEQRGQVYFSEGSGN